MFYVGVLLSIYSTPPFKIHPTAMFLFRFLPSNKKFPLNQNVQSPYHLMLFGKPC